jgi:hypothetical protein
MNTILKKMPKMRKIQILFILITCLQSCNRNTEYEAEELKALEEISSDFLFKEDFNKRMNPPPIVLNGKITETIADSSAIRVFVSDALLPINQEKEDNLWMFKDNNFSKTDSINFYQISNSKKFKELDYREFDKQKINLKKPYIQAQYSEINKYADKPFKILKFSRICFDLNKKNGVVVIEMLEGSEYGTMNGYNGAILIKKENNRWHYVQKK